MRACVLCHFSHVRIFATLWIVALQAPLSIEFSRQEYFTISATWEAPGKPRQRQVKHLTQGHKARK